MAAQQQQQQSPLLYGSDWSTPPLSAPASATPVAPSPLSSYEFAYYSAAAAEYNAAYQKQLITMQQQAAAQQQQQQTTPSPYLDAYGHPLDYQSYAAAAAAYAMTNLPSHAAANATATAATFDWSAYASGGVGGVAKEGEGFLSSSSSDSSLSLGLGSAASFYPTSYDASGHMLLPSASAALLHPSGVSPLTPLSSSFPPAPPPSPSGGGGWHAGGGGGASSLSPHPLLPTPRHQQAALAMLSKGFGSTGHGAEPGPRERRDRQQEDAVDKGHTIKTHRTRHTALARQTFKWGSDGA